ncbi:hypothetical protein PENTCL1PPCAC_29498, partial [Pristionchus entomophagus]
TPFSCWVVSSHSQPARLRAFSSVRSVRALMMRVPRAALATTASAFRRKSPHQCPCPTRTRLSASVYTAGCARRTSTATRPSAIRIPTSTDRPSPISNLF